MLGRSCDRVRSPRPAPRSSGHTSPKPTSFPHISDRQLAPATHAAKPSPDPVHGQRDVGPDEGDLVSPGRANAQRVRQQYCTAVQLDREADEGPSEQDQDHADRERERPAALRRLEGESSERLRAEEQGAAKDEEDLRAVRR